SPLMVFPQSTLASHPVVASLHVKPGPCLRHFASQHEPPPGLSVSTAAPRSHSSSLKSPVPSGSEYSPGIPLPHTPFSTHSPATLRTRPVASHGVSGCLSVP